MTSSKLVVLALLVLVAGCNVERPPSCCDMANESVEIAWNWMHKHAKCAGWPTPRRSPRLDVLYPEARHGH